MPKLLSDILDQQLNETPLLFMKTFSDKSYREDFKKGNIFLNTFDCFVKEEGKNGKGRGDSFEGINVLNNTHLKFYNSENFKLLFEGFAGENGLKSKWNNTENRHLFSLTGIFPNWFEIEKSEKDGDFMTYNCRLVFPDSFAENMQNDFGESIALFSAADFIDKIEEISKQTNLYINHGKVEYLDYSSNPQKRVNAFVENKNIFYFQKDKYFQGQDEYRFVFPTIETLGPYVLKLNSEIELIENVTSISELTQIEYGLQIKFNE